MTAARNPRRPEQRFAAAETPPPDVSVRQAARLARDLFGLSGSVAELGSQQDRNFRVDAPDGKYVLKIANPAVTDTELLCQNAAMRHLARAGMAVPHPHPSLAGADLERARIGGVDVAVRLLGFIDGVPLAESGYLAPRVRARLGAVAAAACRALADFDHAGLDRHLEWDLRQARFVVESYAGHIGDRTRRERLQAATAEASGRLAEVERKLRIRPIHGE